MVGVMLFGILWLEIFLFLKLKNLNLFVYILLYFIDNKIYKIIKKKKEKGKRWGNLNEFLGFLWNLVFLRKKVFKV